MPPITTPYKPYKKWLAKIWFYGMIFLESIIFPIPADPFFIIQCLKNPDKIWKMGLLSTLFSVLGGITMYASGLFLYAHFAPFLINVCSGEGTFLKVHHFMQNWGAWAITFKTFLPIPYKVMALVSGVTELPIALFIASSLMGRGLRFFSLCFLVHRYHAQANALLARYQSWIQSIGYTAILCAIIFLLVRYLWIF